MFRNIAVTSSAIGALGSFYFNLKDELGDLAKSSPTNLGD